MLLFLLGISEGEPLWSVLDHTTVCIGPWGWVYHSNLVELAWPGQVEFDPQARGSRLTMVERLRGVGTDLQFIERRWG
jgi:hypothetical protein